MDAYGFFKQCSRPPSRTFSSTLLVYSDLVQYLPTDKEKKQQQQINDRLHTFCQTISFYIVYILATNLLQVAVNNSGMNLS